MGNKGRHNLSPSKLLPQPGSPALAHFPGGGGGGGLPPPPPEKEGPPPRRAQYSQGGEHGMPFWGEVFALFTPQWEDTGGRGYPRDGCHHLPQKDGPGPLAGTALPGWEVFLQLFPAGISFTRVDGMAAWGAPAPYQGCSVCGDAPPMAR